MLGGKKVPKPDVNISLLDFIHNNVAAFLLNRCTCVSHLTRVHKGIVVICCFILLRMSTCKFNIYVCFLHVPILTKKSFHDITCTFILFYFILFRFLSCSSLSSEVNLLYFVSERIL